ncbi:Serine carboxypeptidase 3 [Capsicum chinense]|nr:Serine carboxypeptidase 3 [Capsicum chinense]
MAYYNEFLQLMLKLDHRGEQVSHDIVRFKVGLNKDISTRMTLHKFNTIDGIFHTALEFERKLKENSFMAAQPEATKAVQKHPPRYKANGSEDACLTGFRDCISIFNNILDIAGDINGPLYYDFSRMDTNLNDNQVKKALGVPSVIDFVSCSSSVYQAMETDWMKNFEVPIPPLLEDGINLLIYAGEYDLICNWLVDGEEKGVKKSYGPLTFLKVHDAGHMVPMDQPKAALEMLQRWTQGELS